jgi:polyhydroxybutyrate depolymerase
MAARWHDLDACQGPPAEDTLPGTGDDTGVHRFTSASCAAGTAVVFMQVDGGGHTWPGGIQYLPKALIGPTTHAFDASEASAQFFAGHSR